MIEAHDRPRQADGVVSQQVGSTAVLLDHQSGEYFSLDEVGSRVWELCDGGRTPDEIATVLCEEFEAELDPVRADVLNLLRELEAAGLVRDGA